ncbi:MAG: hypothetical protein QOG86_1841, partial [Thermoleophilaceae bacterium]|nr:hypothetical protein [Thermoleophilaceae bacterium]
AGAAMQARATTAVATALPEMSPLPFPCVNSAGILSQRRG